MIIKPTMKEVYEIISEKLITRIKEIEAELESIETQKAVAIVFASLVNNRTEIFQKEDNLFIEEQRKLATADRDSIKHKVKLLEDEKNVLEYEYKLALERIENRTEQNIT